MNDPLATYLHDHLAGADLAIDILQSMRDRHHDAPLGQLAAQLLPEVEQDRATLHTIAVRIGSPSSLVKEASSWFAGKASRFKLNPTPSDDFGTFETLEFLALGVLGKLNLWRALQTLAPSDDRIDGFDYAALIARAERHFGALDEARLQLAPTALTPPPT